MKDELLAELEALRDDPVPLLNLPESERAHWMDVLFSLAEKLEESVKPLILAAIPKYLEQLHQTGTAKAHFATWLNDRRWKSFDITEKTASKAFDERAQEIAALRRMIELAKDDKTRQAFQAQLDRLSN